MDKFIFNSDFDWFDVFFVIRVDWRKNDKEFICMRCCNIEERFGCDDEWMDIKGCVFCIWNLVFIDCDKLF